MNIYTYANKEDSLVGFKVRILNGEYKYQIGQITKEYTHNIVTPYECAYKRYPELICEGIAVDSFDVTLKNSKVVNINSLDDVKFINLKKYIEKRKDNNNMDELKIGDRIEVINGKFKGLKGYFKNKIYKPFEYYDLISIEVDELNTITVSEKNVKLIKIEEPKIEDEDFGMFKKISTGFHMHVKIRGKKTTVILDTGETGSVCCHKEDTYNRIEGIDRAFKKALINRFKREIKEDTSNLLM